MMATPRKRLAVLTMLAAAAGWDAASAQSTSPGEVRPETQATASDSPESEVPDVPGLPSFLHGLNGGISFSGIHDAQNGWTVVTTPAAGYSFNDIFSIDASIPIYNYRLADSLSANPRPNALLVARHGELGDVVTAFHVQLLPPHLQYQITFSATAPTGDYTYGLTSGSPTFDLSNHLQHEFRRFTPALELGVGDSSTLASTLVVRNYTTLGPLAHFQAGTGMSLVWGASFEADGYENLPIGDQKIYESVTRRKMTTTVVAGRGVAEDNGFITALDIPVDDHLTLSGYYNHSLRLKDDTVSFSASYVLRGLNEKKDTKTARNQQPADDIIWRSLGPREELAQVPTFSSPAAAASVKFPLPAP